MQNLCDSSSQWRALNNSSLAELIKNLAIMIHDEPVVQMAIRLLTTNCLGGGGIHLRYSRNVTPAPNFQRFIDKYFYSFCKDSIISYLAVGFVPYRIRKNEKGADVPEVLPLGTFTWHVGKSNQNNISTPWESIGKPPPGNEEQQEKSVDNKPLLKYIVNSAYCKEPIHVFPMVNPQILFSCTSPLASLIQPFLSLSHKRECCIRVDSFNSKPSMVYEHQEKLMINDISNSGLAIHNPKDLDGKLNADQKTIIERQYMMQGLAESNKICSKLPGDTISVIAPKNHSIHSLDKLLSPQDLLKEELQFCRLVAMAFGLPLCMLTQSGGMIGGGSNAGSGENWAENVEGSNRLLMDTCKNINRYLEDLLYEVHQNMYGSDGDPEFHIPVIPTIPFEQLMMAHENELIDDKKISLILRSTWGFPLSENASKSRAEKRKAEYVLPFKDKKIDSKKK